MKRIIAAFIATALLSLPSFAMGGKESKEASIQLAPMTIRAGALKGPTGIGMIYLFEGETTLPENASLSVEAVPSADAMAAKLLSGELDAAVLPVNMAAKLYNAGLQYRLAAVVGNGMVKILTTDASIVSLSDLRGRDVFVAGQGATPEFLLRTILPKAGLNPDTDLHMSFNLPYPEIAASLVAGKIDIAVLPEPFATLALKGNPAVRVPFSLSELWTAATGQRDYPMSVFVMRSSLLAERPAAAAALLAAYKASIGRAVADPAAAGALVEKHDMGLKASIAAAAIPAAAFTFVPALEARSSVVALLSVFLAASPASIGSKLPDGDWYASPAR
ncbi:MAG: sulfonate ABC transporter substrate-binding protein [Spirochaetae bacterium HGW-Spirochaetae-7]|jgi:NitT/TauT family transport system substrate-binding protein|nr:MAG: sulfonate ABC transporter substrate-binding protein [Spirochaetae bacterium HGW-Spirochaetae-7]